MPEDYFYDFPNIGNEIWAILFFLGWFGIESSKLNPKDKKLLEELYVVENYSFIAEEGADDTPEIFIKTRLMGTVNSQFWNHYDILLFAHYHLLFISHDSSLLPYISLLNIFTVHLAFH